MKFLLFQKALKIFSILIIIGALFFISSAFFVQATDLDSAYDTMGQVSDGIDTGVNIAGEKSGEALGMVANFFGSTGEFFGKISAKIFELAKNSPDIFFSIATGFNNFLYKYGWIGMGIVGLLIAGFLLTKILQIDFIRRFLICGIIGAVILVVVSLGFVWEIGRASCRERV